MQKVFNVPPIIYLNTKGQDGDFKEFSNINWSKTPASNKDIVFICMEDHEIILAELDAARNQSKSYKAAFRDYQEAYRSSKELLDYLEAPNTDHKKLMEYMHKYRKNLKIINEYE